MAGRSPDLGAPVDEQAVLACGRRLLRLARARRQRTSAGDQWLDNLLARSMDNEAFRIRALRFVDTLPALRDDAELVRLFREYFAEDGLPLPGIAGRGVALAAARVPSQLLAPGIRKMAEILARRFLGGADLTAATRTLQQLSDVGCAVSLDRLGEAVVSEKEADEYARVCSATLAALARWWQAHAHEQALPPELSLKVSSLYSRVTPRDPEGAVSRIGSRLLPLMRVASAAGIRLCLDMEQYDLKAVTIALLRRVLGDPSMHGWDGMGIALQAYLRDTRDDIETLIAWARGRKTHLGIRLVRGAYWDQETVLARRQGWEPPVWGCKAETDRCFEDCLMLLLRHRDLVRTAVATHNVRSMALAMAVAEAQSISADSFEFQLLYGMGGALRDALCGMGYRVRIYVPFGELLPGIGYLVRRLLENSSSQSFLRMGFVPDGDDRVLLSAAPAVSLGEQDQPRGAAVGFGNEPLHRFTGTTERAGFQEALARVGSQLGADYPLSIDGRELTTDRRIVSLNPARFQQVVGRVAAADSTQAAQAVAVAEAAFPDWERLGQDARSSLLERAAGRLRQRRDEFAAWEIFETGKNWPEADADVTEAIDFLRYYAIQARRLAAGVHLDVPGEINRYGYRPRGVGVLLPPWNFPIAILAGMLSAALVTGNTVILKPSSRAPVVAARFLDLLREAGLPKGVATLLPGRGSEVGEYLVRHPRVHFIAFTGSMAVGTRIYRLAAEVLPGQHHLKRVIAEMGGKNAIVVDRSADLDDAIPAVVSSAFGFQGQKCSACSRVILVGEGYDGFRSRLTAAIASLRLGLPEEPGTDMGPVIDAAARDRILAAIRAGSAVARRVRTPDVAHLADGYFVAPTLFEDAPPDSALAQEEIFGPVLTLFRAPDFGTALGIANATRYALTGGVYSRSPAHLARAQREFRVGNLYLNRGIVGAQVGRQPFGGFRLSGVGSKTGGPDYLLQFVEPRTLTENTLRRGFAPSVDLARRLDI